MVVDVTYVELKNFPKYVCQIDVFGVPCLLTASYNSRKGQRLISLTSYDGEIVYLKPTFITNFDRVFLNFNMLLNELNVYVTLQALTVNGVRQTSTDYLNWSSSYRLAFVSLPPVERFVGFKNLGDEEVFEEYEWVVTSVEYLTEGSYQTAVYVGARIIDNKDYSSYAEIDLNQHLVRSFYDEDLQTYSAFTSAVEQLTGTTGWVLDSANNSIKYVDPSQPVDPADPSNQYIYWITYGPSEQKSSIEEVCKLAQYRQNPQKPESEYENCVMQGDSIMLASSWSSVGHRVTNPAYDPNAEQEEVFLPLETVAQKVIYNAESNVDEVLQLLSQDYITIVINSIFETNPSKQFVTLEDLKPQFELNKVLVQ